MWRRDLAALGMDLPRILPCSIMMAAVDLALVQGPYFSTAGRLDSHKRAYSVHDTHIVNCFLF